jgi:hypothetical protein
MDKLELYNEQEKEGELGDDKARRTKFRLLRPLGKGHNIVVHMHKSPVYTAFFLELVDKNISIDNYTK